MTKLHETLLGAQDPTLLEIRITANHGADPRFSFLRRGGKFSDVWEKIRKKPSPKLEPPSQMGLVGYDSDESSDEEPAVTEVVQVVAEEVIERDTDDADSEELRAKKEAKAEKARNWAKQRRAARDADGVVK